LVFAGIGTTDKWENFLRGGGGGEREGFQRAPAVAKTTARRHPSLRFPKGNAPFRFRAGALFSCGSRSKLPEVHFGKFNIARVGPRP
jgi:hypothetical protein